VSDDDAKDFASVNVAVMTCVPSASTGGSITATPPGPTGAVPSVVVLPWNVSVNVTVPVAVGGDTVAIRTEQSPAGTCAWKIVPSTAQTKCGSGSIDGPR
jgi:hypothetical protein